MDVDYSSSEDDTKAEQKSQEDFFCD